jgi:hypothetical protein
MTVACVSSTCSDGRALSTLQVGEARGWEIASGHLTLPHRRLLYLQQVLLLPFPGLCRDRRKTMLATGQAPALVRDGNDA